MEESGLVRLSHYLGFRHSKGALLLPLTFLVFGFALAYFLPLFDRHIPGGAPITQIFLEIIWLSLMVFGLLGQREKFRKKHGERAYQQLAIRFFIPAGILMVNGILRPIWVGGDFLPAFLGPIYFIFGIYGVLVGVLLEVKGIKSLGVDRAAFVYTVFPEKGEKVDSQLYAFLRHPLYAAMSHLCVGIALLAGTWQGLLCSLVFVLKLCIWSKIEETELIKRFGAGYLEYCEKVPAFIPHLKDMKNFLKTLLFLFVFCWMSSPSFAEDKLVSLVESRYPHLEKIYHDLHQHPELSKQEKETSAKIAAEMKSVGFDVTTNVGGYGVVSVLKNGSGPTALVRTDMDALPVQEKTGLPYKSQVPNVMHACGHDVHMSIFLGTAYALSQLKDQWKGTVVMIAQPAEEVGAGAKAMIEGGLFKKIPKPDYALALHVADSLPAGQLGYRSGFSLANVDFADITIFGKGGHGAKPHTTIDPIVLASQVVLGLQTLVSREIDPLDPAVVTVGSIHAGTKHNIIPPEAKLQLTVRSYAEDVREHLKKGITRITENVAASARAPRPKIKFSEGIPAVYNDPELVSLLIPVFEEVVERQNVEEIPQSMGGEDFGLYSKEGRIPGFMFGLGVQPHSKGDLPSAHSPEFAPVFEPAFKIGVKVMTKAILKLQSRQYPLQRDKDTP